MSELYTGGEYLEKTRTWHAEDSPWKADQIAKIIVNSGLRPKTLVEVGCGAGKILEELSKHPHFDSTRLAGYDISPQAIELCRDVNADNTEFVCRDLFDDDDVGPIDMLLAIDVFEHVPDYMGFLEKCQSKAEYKVYHIPLDVHVSSVLRNTMMSARQSLGHLHYFTAETAIASVEDTGHEILDHFYTNGAMGLYRQHPSLKRAVANVPRWLFSKLSVPLSARLFGGYSLMVLAK